MRKYLVIASCLCLGIFCGLVQQTEAMPSPAWVSVNRTGNIWTDKILLGSIANISCADTERRQELINMSLGTISRPGDKKVLTDYVLRLLIDSSKVNVQNVKWQIPAQVMVTRLSQTVTGKEILQVAENKMAALVKKNGEKRVWKIVPVAEPKDVLLSPGKVTYAVEIPYGIKYEFPTMVYVKMLVKGKEEANVLCRLQLHTYDKVVVSAAYIKANQVITAQDVRLENRDLGVMESNYVNNLDAVIGKVLRYPLEPGKIVRKNALAKVVLVRMGDFVHINAQKGTVVVQTDGVAMGTGGKDDYIRVKNTVTGKIINARIVKPHEVVVDV